MSLNNHECEIQSSGEVLGREGVKITNHQSQIANGPVAR
jgi:hypothetical protein